MNIQIEQFVFLVICALLAFFVYCWAFCFDIPGYKEGVKRWDLIRTKFRTKKVLRLCPRCTRKLNSNRGISVVVSIERCSNCKKESK